jgi:hypothetical protein
MVIRFEQEEKENQASAHAGHQAAVDFEELLRDLSAAFVRVSVDQIDSEIERWLQRIGLVMDVDRCTIGQRNSAGGAFYRSHQWGRPGVIVNRDTDYFREFPWLYAKISS